MANALLERETLDRSDIETILAGEPLPPLKTSDPATDMAPETGDPGIDPEDEPLPNKPPPFAEPDPGMAD